MDKNGQKCPKHTQIGQKWKKPEKTGKNVPFWTGPLEKSKSIPVSLGHCLTF